MMDGDAVRELVSTAQDAVEIERSIVDLTDEGYGLISTKDIRQVPFNEPLPETVKAHTLRAVIDLLENEKPEGAFIHIVGPTEVRVIGTPRGKGLRRPVHLIAQATTPSPTFRTFMVPEALIIELQTLYQQRADHADVVRLVGNVKAEAVKTLVDDGFTQEVTARSGTTVVERQEVKNPVELAPYRTFREVDQPATAFVLRFRKASEDSVQAALYEADGGLWRLEAIECIREWLAARTTVPVVG